MRYDAGLQPERTSLSWNRTALSMVVGGAVGLKVLPYLIGSFGIAVALVVIIAGAALGLVAHRRSERRVKAMLNGSAVLSDGRLMLGVAVAVTATCALTIATVVYLVVLG